MCNLFSVLISRFLGRQGLASLYAAANELKLGRYASEHDIKNRQENRLCTLWW